MLYSMIGFRFVAGILQTTSSQMNLVVLYSSCPVQLAFTMPLQAELLIVCLNSVPVLHLLSFQSRCCNSGDVAMLDVASPHVATLDVATLTTTAFLCC